MSHEIETIAYTNETPWHGLGVNVEKTTSVAQMLKKASLDWEVSKRPIYIDGGKEEPQEVPGHFALVRDSDQKVLDVCGKAYQPVQNEQAFEFFREFVEAGDAHMETAGSLRGGRYVWGLARLGQDFKLKGKDQVNGYLLVASPHEAGKSLIAKFTTVRVVCNNTITLALSKTEKGHDAFRMAHRSKAGFDEAMRKKAKETMGIARDQMSEFKATAEKLQKIKMDFDSALDVLVPVYQPQSTTKAVRQNFEKDGVRTLHIIKDIRERAPGCIGEDDNAWTWLNAVTYFADHVTSRSDDKRLTNAWFGKTAKHKERVLELMLA